MSSACSTRHKRSKSANNLEFTSHEISYCLGKGYCTSLNPHNSRKPNGIEEDHQYSSNITNDESSNHRASLENDAAYNIGGFILTANSIEHSTLHCRTPRVGRWFEAIISTAMRKKSGEEKQLISSNFTLLTSQPLVLFALCTGGSSDPILRVYTAKNVMEELDLAKRDFLQANVIVKKSRKIFLPKLLDRFAKEAALSCEELVSWVSANMEMKGNDDATLKCVNGKKKKKAAMVTEWLPYNSKFRYVFGKDLT